MDTTMLGKIFKMVVTVPGSYLGALVDLLEKLGGKDGDAWLESLKRFLRKENPWPAPSTSADLHEIRFTLPATDGTTRRQWIKRLEKKGFRVCDDAKQLLLSSEFKPTKGVIHEVVIIKGDYWKKDDERTTANIRAEADKRKLEKPNAEVAFLIREKFTDKELEAMGLTWIIVMHEPIKDSDRGPHSLSMGRLEGDGWLYAIYGTPDSRWNHDDGFAFVVPQSA